MSHTEKYMKLLEIILTNNYQTFTQAQGEMLLAKIKEDIKGKSWIKRLTVVTMSVLHSSDLQLQHNLNQIRRFFFSRNQQTDSKIYMKTQKNLL